MKELYKVVKNFLSKKECDLLTDYTRIRHRLHRSYTEAPQVGIVASHYGDPLMESLMLNKRKEIEEHTGYKLLPTYSFYRVYTKYTDLPEHQDRPACEISATIMLGSDKTPWPISMGKKEITQEPGDAVFYKGCDIPHARKEFLGDWHSQVFLHYVDANGPYTSYYMDRRLRWGEIKPDFEKCLKIRGHDFYKNAFKA